jgi:glycosyltransferase involved in cell wall biosynthesis
MRCYWPAKYMGATVATWQEVLSGKQIEDKHIICQKLGNIELMRKWLDQGSEVWWDICDPAWWFSPEAAKPLADMVTGVVASNPGLAEDFTEWSGRACEMIPDRVELEHYPKQREHCAAKPVRLIWFGVSVNRVSLPGTWANLARLVANGHDVGLTIMDNQPEFSLGMGNDVPTGYVRWGVETEAGVISSHDIALLPPYPGPWGRVKSNNKTLAAWACGLPVTNGLDYRDLEWLVSSHETRATLGRQGRKDVETMWQVERSAREWERLLRV